MFTNTKIDSENRCFMLKGSLFGTRSPDYNNWLLFTYYFTYCAEFMVYNIIFICPSRITRLHVYRNTSNYKVGKGSKTAFQRK